MPKLIKSVLKYRKHKATGPAVVTLNGQDIYLGPWKTRASLAEYDRLIGEWIQGGRTLRQSGTSGLTVVELIAAYLDYARRYYPPKSVEPDRIAEAIPLIKKLYGRTLASEFGPTSLKAVRQAMVDGGLVLNHNQLSSIELGDFDALTNLESLNLYDNQLSSIESGAFSGLTNLTVLYLHQTALTDLNLEAANFSSLTELNLDGNITSVSLRNAVVNQTSLTALMNGGKTWWTGIGELDGVTELDLSGIDFADVADLWPLYMMDDLTELWLVDTANLDAFRLDRLLDNLATIEGTGTEGILYMTEADYEALNAAGRDRLSIWNDESGHHVEFLSLGDVNHDTEVNGLDVDPFVDVLLGIQEWSRREMRVYDLLAVLSQ